MTTLVSPGVSVTIIDESFYVAVTAPTVPLFFIATRADKKKVDGITAAPGALESGIVRTITSLSSSVDTYGVPYFRTDGLGAQLHGDSRNEYGLFAINQFLTVGNRAYVVRADVDLADADVVTFTAGAPSYTGASDGTMTGIGIDQGMAQAETWTMTAVSSAALAISSISRSAGIATVTAGVVHNLVNNSWVTVAGATEVDYNGTYKVTVTGPNTFTYVVLNTPSSPATTATALTYTTVNSFTVTGFLSGAQAAATVGVPYNNGIVSFRINAGATLPYANAETFVMVITSSTASNPLGANDAARRNEIVQQLQEQIRSNTDVRSDYYEYNLILCPGYHEVVEQLLDLNLAVNDEAFVIADTPCNLTPEDTATWSLNIQRYRSPNLAYYYPWTISSNLDGVEVLSAPSGLALKTYGYSDNVSEVWFPPAGFRRGVATGIANVGYVTGTLGTATTFISTPLNQGQRDVLYEFLKNVNPIPFFPGRGIVVFGQKTSYNLTSALDRINVMRLLIKMKREIRKAAMAYLFELNDRITRDSIKQMIDDYLNDILVRRGLYDFLVICDEQNNTPVRIDRNELWVDILVKPAKAVEFIYIPIRVLSTGANMGMP